MEQSGGLVGFDFQCPLPGKLYPSVYYCFVPGAAYRQRLLTGSLFVTPLAVEQSGRPRKRGMCGLLDGLDIFPYGR